MGHFDLITHFLVLHITRLVCKKLKALVLCVYADTTTLILNLTRTLYWLFFANVSKCCCVIDSHLPNDSLFFAFILIYSRLNVATTKIHKQTQKNSNFPKQ